MEYNYEKLEVYDLARDYVRRIYQATAGFPVEEKFGLTNQARRAAVSVALNLAEGSSRNSKKDFALFVERAVGSLVETRTALDLSVDLGFLAEDNRQKLEPLLQELFFKLQALKKSLRSSR